MSALRQALADYLRARRALGSTLDRAEKLLAQFVSYLEQRDADVITVEHAVAWATLPGGAGWWHALRLSAVRRFAIYVRNLDDRTAVNHLTPTVLPALAGLFPRPRTRRPRLRRPPRARGAVPRRHGRRPASSRVLPALAGLFPTWWTSS